MAYEKKVTIEVNGAKLHLVLGKKLSEWRKNYDQDECWDFRLEELLDGSVEINDEIWYWYIDGRCYETTEQA